MPGSVEHLTDTTINVVDYFKSDAMGRTRRYILDVPALELDRDLVARDVHAEFRLLRVGAGVLAEGIVRADVELECVRTLDHLSAAREAEFAEQFRPTIDLATGREMTYEDDPGG